MTNNAKDKQEDVNVRIAKPVHKAAKIEAAKKEKSIKQYLEDLVIEDIKKAEKPN